MPITSFEKGLQQGQQQGQQQCQRTMLEKQLEARFGPLGPEVRQRVENLSAERLEELALALLTARSLQELGLGD